jgi:hypothetical protein
VNANNQRPDFSFIRSPFQRAEAERSYEMGIAIADGLYAASEALGRAIAAIARTVSRKPVANW